MNLQLLISQFGLVVMSVILAFMTINIIFSYLIEAVKAKPDARVVYYLFSAVAFLIFIGNAAILTGLLYLFVTGSGNAMKMSGILFYVLVCFAVFIWYYIKGHSSYKIGYEK